ncbi:MAG: tyrosine-type recombinase/integrase [Gordonibacter sp.]|uniref:tyrosine-type recombinase/integrase n=1 Tax=Gordonibacter sp. TaxID=1968902 RepID=UPI002FCA8A8E
MQVDERLDAFRTFIEANGNSPNVCAMYFKRVRTFLGKHSEAMTADEQVLREIVDEYIESLPVTSGIGVTATAVRYYWTMRFGKPYFRRFDPRSYPVNQSIERECLEFEAQLMSSGRLSPVTVRQRATKVKQYLYTMFGSAEFERGMVNLASAMVYISEKIAHTSASTKRGFCTEIRAYASFLCANGHEDTAGPITKVALKGPEPMDSLPKCINEEDFEALTTSVDPESARGKRDLAMLLLMGNLGLRRSDVALLALDDVDWANGILRIRHSKSVSDRSIPLDSETGSALEDYVVNARPMGTGSRSLFLPDGLEAKGPRMTFEQVGGAIGLLSEKAGVRDSGTHPLRRAVATNMVNNGVPIKPIADILGHETLATTMGYLRVNVESLRKAAAPWPKEVAI